MDRELNEKELENVLGGAIPAVVDDKVKENSDLHRSKLIDTNKLIDYEEVARIAHEHHLSDEEIHEFVKGLKPTIVSRSEFTDEILKELGMEGQFISSKDYQNYIAKKEEYKKTFRDKVLEAGLAKEMNNDMTHRM